MTIDWGDGTAAQMVPGTATTASHTYASGPATRTITAGVTGLANPLDTTFGPAHAGTAVTDLGSSSDQAEDVVVQPDGKIVAAGGPGFSIVRYNADGTPDTTFGTGGKAFAGLATDHCYAIALQPDGKIVAAGGPDFKLVRFNANGTLDTSFGTNGVENSNLGSKHTAYDVAIRSDGKIVAVGNNSNDVVIARYLSNGQLDTGFSGNGHTSIDLGGYEDHGRAVSIQPDGKLLIAGRAGMAGADAALAVIRTSAGGNLDTTFGTGGIVKTNLTAGVEDVGSDVALQPDGKVVVTGRQGDDPNANLVVLRYTAAGVLDTSFGTGGYTTVDFTGSRDLGKAVKVLSNGQILVAGRATVGGNQAMALVRFNADGSLDTTFGSGGKVTTDLTPGSDYANGLAIDGNGEAVVAGSANDADFAVARYWLGTTATVPVTVAHVPPTLTVSGPATADEGAAYTLNLAAAETGPHTISSWSIDWGDGSGPQTVAGNPSSVTHVYDDGPNAYMPTATATDDVGSYAVTGPRVTVADVAPMPSISGLPSGTIPAGTSLALAASATDPSAADKAAGLIYAWSVTKDGGAYAPGTPTDQGTFGFTPLATGTYVLTLTATDKDGATGTASSTLNVAAAAPTFGLVLPAGPGLAGQPVVAQLHDRQPQATTVASWSVDWGDGTTQTVTAPPTSASGTDDEWDVSHAYATAGSYAIHPVATDTAGAPHDAGTATETVQVPPPSVSPLIIPTATAGTPLTITATAAPYQNNGDALGFQWSFVDPASPSTPIMLTTGGPTVTFTPPDAGNWSVTLTVTDATATAAGTAAGPTTVTQAFTVAVPMPLAITGPSVVAVGGSANFNATGSAANNVAWTATLNGNAVASGTSTSFAFTPASAGAYTITATGTDANGASHSATATLAVTQLAPDVNIGGPAVGFQGRALTFRAVPSQAGADSLTYQWSLRNADGTAYAYPAGQPMPATGPSDYVVPGVLAPGRYQVAVTATDPRATTAPPVTRTFNFQVLADPQPGVTYGTIPAEADWTSEAYAMTRQSDGKIVVAGISQYYDDPLDDPNVGFIARFNPDLTLDQTFGANHSGLTTLVDAPSENFNQFGWMRALAINPVNRDIIIVGGGLADGGTTSQVEVAEIVSQATIEPNGTAVAAGAYDPAFNGGSPFTYDTGANNVNYAWSVLPLANGSMLVGGSTAPSPFGSYNQPIYDFLLLKITPDGHLEPLKISIPL